MTDEQVIEVWMRQRITEILDALPASDKPIVRRWIESTLVAIEDSDEIDTGLLEACLNGQLNVAVSPTTGDLTFALTPRGLDMATRSICENRSTRDVMRSLGSNLVEPPKRAQLPAPPSAPETE